MERKREERIQEWLSIILLATAVANRDPARPFRGAQGDQAWWGGRGWKRVEGTFVTVSSLVRVRTV